MPYLILSFVHFCTDKRHRLVFIWLLSLFLGGLISFSIGSDISVDLGSLLASRQSALWLLITVIVYFFLPVLTVEFCFFNSLLVLFLVIFKGMLTGFLIISSLISFPTCAWLIVLVFQIADACVVLPAFVSWDVCIQGKLCRLGVLCAAVCFLSLSIYSINTFFIFPLCEKILFSVT